MITMQDLDEAIAECQGQPHPTANTCIKLAAFLTIKQFMNDQENAYEGLTAVPGFSYSLSPNLKVISYNSGTPFSEKINGKSSDEVLELMDELMTTLQAINPRLYASVMRKL